MKQAFRFISSLALTCALLIASSQAQQEEKFTPSVEGQVSLSANDNALFAGIGGVTLKFIFKKFSLALCMAPALKIEKPDDEIIASPLLCVGPQVYFLKHKRLILNFPFSYKAAKKNLGSGSRHWLRADKAQVKKNISCSLRIILQRCRRTCAPGHGRWPTRLKAPPGFRGSGCPSILS